MSAEKITLTNTILVPSADSLVSKNPLGDATIGADIQSYYNDSASKETVESNQFRIYIVSGQESVPAGFCENIDRLRVNRNVETKRSGGNGDYLVKLPGRLSYEIVIFTHVYCDNDVFMNWLINGADKGGVQRANIEIRVGSENNGMLYTLRDAFPIAWHLGTMSVNTEGLITNRETLKYAIDADTLLVENVTIAYSLLDYQHIGS